MRRSKYKPDISFTDMLELNLKTNINMIGRYNIEIIFVNTKKALLTFVEIGLRYISNDLRKNSQNFCLERSARNIRIVGQDYSQSKRSERYGSSILN